MEAISTELVAYIEHNTCDKVKSKLWRRLHTGRITSSLFEIWGSKQEGVDFLSSGDRFAWANPPPLSGDLSLVEDLSLLSPYLRRGETPRTGLFLFLSRLAER